MKDDEINQTFLMKQILDELAKLKSNMSNGEIKHIQDSIEDWRRDQKALKDDISDIKKKLLDPETGVIVRVNENTKFRMSEEGRYEDYLEFNMDLQDLKKWQGGINKAMWIIFTAIIAIGIKIIFATK